MTKVAVIVGSLRRESINRTLAEALSAIAGPRLDLELVEVGDLPLYNEDLWADPPAAVLDFKEALSRANAVLFVTPEYNRYFTPAIKNAVDWGTRPRGQNAWLGKPAAICGASPGPIGTAAAQASLRGLLVTCGMVVMGIPELMLTFDASAFADGAHREGPLRERLDAWIGSFADWIELTRTKPQID